MAIEMISTASEAISFARKLEEDSAKFYENLAKRYPSNNDIFLRCAKENKAFIVQFERAYYGVISDALEGCFAFRIDPEKYGVKAEPTEGGSYADVLQETMEMEDRMIKFYLDASEQSMSLLPEVPRVFVTIAKKRSERQRLLELLVAKDQKEI